MGYNAFDRMNVNCRGRVVSFPAPAVGDQYFDSGMMRSKVNPANLEFDVKGCERNSVRDF